MNYKALIQRCLQKVLGFKTYLFLFSLYRIKTIKHYEPGFNKFLNIIPADGIILDVGANIGITAVPLAKKFRNAEIYAFEPIEANYSTLTRIIKLFKLKNISALKTAVGSNSAIVQMVMPIVEGVKKQGLSRVHNGNTSGTIENVQIIPISSIPFKDKVVAIKMDVEGHELEILRGAERLLLTDKPIIYCELWDSLKVEAISYLSGFKYAPFVYQEETDTLGPYNNQSTDNFFFIAE